MVTERLMTHGDQVAESDMEISLDGDGARGRVISRSVAKGTSRQVFYPKMVGNAAWMMPTLSPFPLSWPTAQRPS